MKLPHFAKVAFLVLLILVSLWLMSPWLVSDIQSNGTVNARLVTVQAPINGMIVRTPPDVGEPVWEGTPLTEIVDDKMSLGIVASLDVEREMLATRVNSLEAKYKTLDEIRKRLTQQTTDHRSEYSANLRHQVIEVGARIKYWDAVNKERKQALERTTKLQGQGVMPMARLEQAQALFDQGQQEIEQAKAEKDRLEQELGAAAKGIFVREGRNDVPYSQQRLDEVSISLADLAVQIEESKGRLAATERRFKDELQRSGKREKIDLMTPVSGIVWRRFVISQSYVQQGNDLLKILDCSKLIAEVPVSESKADGLSIGQELNVRFQGNAKKYKAEITDIKGTRSVTPNLEYAAAPPLLKKDEALLSLQITDPSLDKRSEKFCHVGRRVEVRLPGLMSFGGRQDSE